MRAGLAALIAATLLAGCDGLFVEPSTLAPGAQMQLTIDGVPLGMETVVARVDRVDVRLTRPDGGTRTEVLDIQRGGRLHVVLHLEPREVVPGLAVRAEMFAARVGAALFRGETVLDAGSLRSAAVEVKPVAALITPTPPELVFDALGAVATVSGVVKFATGDPIPGATPVFSSDAPSIIDVTPTGTVTARQNGIGAVRGSFGNAGVSIPVRVQQVATSLSVTPTSVTVRMGDSVQIAAIGSDRRGNPIGQTAVSWRSSNNLVARVGPAGIVHGVQGGAATIMASSGTISVSIPVSVTLPFDLPESSMVWAVAGGLGVGDLTGTTQVFLPASGASAPTFAPDKRRIAYIQSSTSALYVSDLIGNAQRLGPSTITLARWPEFSADGQWIYFSGRVAPSGADLVYRVHPDGSGLELITSQYQGTAPTSSPDGTRVAYGRLTRPGSGEASDLIVQPIGGQPVIVATGVAPMSLAWSPDGQWIAYLTYGRGELWIIRPDGSGRRRLGVHGLFEGISWSPDSRWIVGMETFTTLVDVASGVMYDLAWKGGQPAWWR